MINIAFDYALFDKMFPVLYDIDKLDRSPYIYYTKSNQAFPVILSDGKIYHVRGTPTVSFSNEQLDILENFAKNQQLLLNITSSGIEVLYNYTTANIHTTLVSSSYTSIFIDESTFHYIAFDFFGKPVRIPKTKIKIANLISESFYFLNQNIDDANMDICIDVFGLGGAGITERERKLIKPLIEPKAEVFLTAKQTEHYQRMIKGPGKSKKQEKKTPDVNSIIEFSDFLEGTIPVNITETVDVVMDYPLNLDDYKIKAMQYDPSLKKLIFTVKIEPGEQYDTEILTELLGSSEYLLHYDIV